MTATSDSPIACAKRLGDDADADVYLYNGELRRGDDLKFINAIHEHRHHANVTLLLVTNGGMPDAAYKIARYLQDCYEKFTVIVAGKCKSAGTLLAVGADEIAFAPYGELGPLDIQTFQTDNLAGMESGLTITEAMDALAVQAIRKHAQHYRDILNSTGRVVSFASAAETATQLVTGLFAPIFGQIDPYDVGQKARSMRIAHDYGKRLAQKSENLKDDALDKLTRAYPSHSFVLDYKEASELFKNVRKLTDDESALVKALGGLAREETNLSAAISFPLTQKPQPEAPDDSSKPAEGSSKTKKNKAAQPAAGTDDVGEKNA